MQKGDVPTAARILENLRTFAQSMNNKAQALSDHIDGKNLTTTKVNVNGKEQDSSTVFYQTKVANNSNTFRKSTKGVYVQFSSDKSVATAKAYMQMPWSSHCVQSIARCFPELAANASPEPIVDIHPKLDARKVGTAAQNTATPLTGNGAQEPSNTNEVFTDPNAKKKNLKDPEDLTSRL